MQLSGQGRGAGGRPRVVIIGGGLGGLFCAKALRHAPVDVVMIDRVNHYLYQALIYQVATCQLDTGEVAMPQRERVGAYPNTTVLLAEVTGIDVNSRCVHLVGCEDVTFDYLVLATGVRESYFGHNEWAQYAPTLKTLKDAVALREHILTSFELAELADDPKSRPDLTTFVIVGGGPTGTEMAGALADMVRYTLHRDFKRFDARLARIILCEAGPRVLPAFSPEISEKVRRKLQSMGVEVRVDSPVESIDAMGAVIRGERVYSRNVIWTAGVKATAAAEWLGGAQTDKIGRLIANKDLTVPGYDNIYVIGDLAHTETEAGDVLPMVAQVALQGGKHVGKAIAARVDGREGIGDFSYFDKGLLATVGRRYAVMETANGKVKMTGMLAKFIWAFIHLLYQMPNEDKMVMFTKWTWAAATKGLSSRVIVEPIHDVACDVEEPTPAPQPLPEREVVGATKGTAGR